MLTIWPKGATAGTQEEVALLKINYRIGAIMSSVSCGYPCLGGEDERSITKYSSSACRRFCDPTSVTLTRIRNTKIQRCISEFFLSLRKTPRVAGIVWRQDHGDPTSLVTPSINRACLAPDSSGDELHCRRRPESLSASSSTNGPRRCL